MDNATTNGVWQVGGGLADNPVGNTAVLTVFNSNNYIVQYIAGANSCFVRIKQTNWQPWVRIDNFGCNTASELASLLGGVTKSISINQDFNDFTTPGILYVSAGGSITSTLGNRPSNLNESFMMFYFPAGPTQIIITTWAGLKLYKRSYDNGWKKWQLVTGTEVEYA